MKSARLNEIVNRFSGLSICVVGDVFLDRYFDLDRRLSEVSLETGLEAYQAVRVRHYPGGGGNVAKNLAVLGVGRVAVLSCIGADGDGFELKRAFDRLGVDLSLLIEREDRCTPGYTKPMLSERGKPARELERVDIRDRRRLPREVEQIVLRRLGRCVREMDGIIVVDQVPEAGCGVITTRVRHRIAELGRRYPRKVIFVDSRCRIEKFRYAIIKPNKEEAVSALGLKRGRAGARRIAAGALAMARRTHRPVYVTLGKQGCLCAHEGNAFHVPTFRPGGPIDIVGAGDSFSAGATAALCAGAEPQEAGLIGNLAASITIQQLGVTGVATRSQLRTGFQKSRQDF